MRHARLKEIASVRPSNVDKKTVDGETPVHLCNYTDVYYNDFITTTDKFTSATATPAQISSFTLRRGDVLLTKDSESADDIAVPALVKEDLFGVLCGYHLALVRPDADKVDPRFLHRAVSTQYVNRQFQVGATGVTRYGLRTDVIKDARIPLPTLKVQRLIADFLDRETQRIDALVEAKRRMIDLLEEKRNGLLASLITSEVSDTNALRETGVDWLPRIPGHWSMIHLRRVLKSIVDGPFGSAFSSDDYTDEGAAVVRLGNIGKARYNLNDQAYITIPLAAEFARHRVIAGDVLMAGLGHDDNHAGRACIAPDLGPAIVKGKCYRLRPRSGLVDSEFLVAFLSSDLNAAQVSFGAQGSTRTMINLSIAKQLQVPYPPVDEQRRVVEIIRRSGRTIDKGVDALRRQLALLAEYRQALITNAVTGQLDEATLKGHTPADEVVSV